MLELSSCPAPPMSQASRRAFTLIEVLVVVFILAVLIALLQLTVGTLPGPTL